MKSRENGEQFTVSEQNEKVNSSHSKLLMITKNSIQNRCTSSFQSLYNFCDEFFYYYSPSKKKSAPKLLMRIKRNDKIHIKAFFFSQKQKIMLCVFCCHCCRQKKIMKKMPQTNIVYTRNRN